MQREISERWIIALLGAVQFINILDFMIVMPLGPDFAVGLGIPTAEIGWISGSYSAAAAISGIAGSLFLDRLDRRVALALAMIGLVIGTAAGGFAIGLASLVGARIVAGAFGGPATAVALSIIADQVPPERRGKALGTVMAAFSLASILGVPAGLELARIGGWRLPFFAIAGFGIVLIALSISLMPPMRKHLEGAEHGASRFAVPRALLRRPEVRLALACYAAVTVSVFMVIPYISTFLIYNVQWPREKLGILYLIGGVASFVSMRFVGGWVDRIGASPIAWIGTLLYLIALATGFMVTVPIIPIMLLFVVMMTSASFRSIPVNTVSTQVPFPTERAGFMSMQSAAQHIFSSIGSFLSAQLLLEHADHSLGRMPLVSGIAAGVALLVPILLGLTLARIQRRSPPSTPVQPAAPLRPAE